MTTNSRFAVAIHTLAALGFVEKSGLERLSSQRIAKSVNTNPVVIRNLLRLLKKAGLVDSKEGKGGGVWLTQAPSKISLHDIYAAVAEEDASVLCSNKRPEFKPCPVSRGMKRVIPSIFEEVDRAVAKTLQSKTLKDVIDGI